jgi:hypothetical protein
MEFGLLIGFIEFLQLVTASYDYGLTVLHISESLQDTLCLLSLLQSSLAVA